MNFFISIVPLILLAALVVAAFLFILLGIDSVVRGHDLPTSRCAARKLREIISCHAPGAKTFYDLGCGRGWLTAYLKKQLSHLAVFGVDTDAIRIFFAKLRAFARRLDVKYGVEDALKTDVRSADVVYAYLSHDLLPPLEEKLKREMRPGGVIITNTSRFTDWKPRAAYVIHPENQGFEKLFVYIKE